MEVSPSSTAHRVRWAEVLPPTPVKSCRTVEEKHPISSLGVAGSTSISCFLALRAYPWTMPEGFRIRRHPLGAAAKASTSAWVKGTTSWEALRLSWRTRAGSTRGSSRSPWQTASVTAVAAAGSGAVRTATSSPRWEASNSWAKTSGVRPGTRRELPTVMPKAASSR